ncbi:CopG family ribbon-helix-helix protein [Pseudomonadota bacterium]
MSQSTTMTIRLEPELKARLDKLAEATHRSKSFLASEAVREFIDINEWQIKEINAAVKEADEGAFATPEEENAVFKKWGLDAD